jgi:hyperosmotically inducible periplasmic protein
MTSRGTPFHIHITTRRLLCASVFVLLLASTLSGCAVYHTYEKCGFSGCPGDAQITAEIQSQINQRGDLESTAITVQTLDHTVYLYGVVSSGLEISDAEAIARSVPGVRQVINSMAISQSR